MKKSVICVSLTLCLLCLVGFVVWTGACIWDYQTSSPPAHPIEHLMTGPLYATGFLLLSIIGIPAGILSLKSCPHRWERICGAVTLVASSIFLGIGICLWLFWP